MLSILSMLGDHTQRPASYGWGLLNGDRKSPVVSGAFFLLMRRLLPPIVYKVCFVYNVYQHAQRT